MINITALSACTTKNLSFPEVIKCLTQIGVERYYTDLVRMEKVFYSQNNESYIDRMPIANMPELAKNFNHTEVKKAIAAIQKDEIDYPAFIRQIAAAGVANYIVFIDGKHVTYIGHKGEFHVEKFPNTEKNIEY